jgi:predicted Fe-S protein YdhL (DUF1289 family)
VTVQSPCLDLCKFDRKTDMCVGCFRTTDEIRKWRKMTDHKRRSVLSERRRREGKLASRKVPA